MKGNKIFILVVLFTSLLTISCAVSEQPDNAGNNPEDSSGEDSEGPTDTGQGEYCGDYIVNETLGEECDGDFFSDSATCVGMGFSGGEVSCNDNCTTNTSECHNCGDGEIQADEDEECDNGELNSENGSCLPGCIAATCGDEYIMNDADAGLPSSADGGVIMEECDNGNDNDDDSACTSECKLAFCGDALIWEDDCTAEECEVCDDGVNDGSYNGCAVDCLLLGPHCGDSNTDDGFEECDDGNESNNDSCTTACADAYCGDGMVWNEGDGGVEECDDGNEEIADGCDPDCIEEYCGDEMVGWSRPKEGFETGDLSQLPWATGISVGTQGPFFVEENIASHGGSYLLRSENNPDGPFEDGFSYLQIELDVKADSEICFWYSGIISTSSSFTFSVDTEEVLSDNAFGSEWYEFCALVTAGDGRVLLWEHTRHDWDDGGTVYLDDIKLPITAEECDDGGNVPGDGCSSTCLNE